MDSESREKTSSDSCQKEAANLPEQGKLALVTLLWRSTDAKAPNPILGCPWAQETFDRCIISQDEQFTSHARHARWVRYMCNRTKTMDKWCQQFIDNHAGEPVQVLNLCCGLDARCLRMRRNPATVRWIDVDIPAIVNLRERVMISGSGDYSLRNLSITTDGWYRDIPADRRTMILCENYLYYMDAAKVQNMIRDLVDYFGAGQFVFDTAGTLTAKYRPEATKKLALQPRWTIDDVRGIERYHGALKLTGRVRWQEYMGSDGPMGQHLPPVFGPWTTALLALRHSAAFKDVLQAVRFDFGQRATSASSSEFTRASLEMESAFSEAVALTPAQSRTAFSEEP